MTQGRGDGHEWVTEFMVSHSIDGFQWQYVADVYGNQKVCTTAIVTLVDDVSQLLNAGDNEKGSV